MENPPSTTENIFIFGNFLATNELEGYSVLLQSDFQEVEIYLKIILNFFFCNKQFYQ